MQISEFITIFISFATGGGLLFLLTINVQRKKIRAEYETLLAQVKGSELENVEKAISIWRESAEKLTQRVKELEAEIIQLKEIIKKIKKR